MKHRAFAALAALAALAAGASTAAAQEAQDPAMPEVFSMRERADVIDRILRERLDTVVPMLMREQGVNMWVMIAREYNEDPVVKTMLPARWLNARRRTILIFFDPDPASGDGAIERIAVSRYAVGDLFEAAWVPEEQPDQWARLAEIIAERDPARIAVNVSSLHALADGMTATQYREMRDALPPRYRDRIVETHELGVGWLETRTPAEMALYPDIVRMAHAIIAEGFSENVITPGETTADDVVWWYRDRIREAGFTTWFHPSVSIQRNEAALADMETFHGEADTVIRPGDLLHVDFGITYLRLNTDTQHHAYVLRPGERDAPAGLKAGLAAANRVQDILISEFRAGDTGNEILARALARVRDEDLGGTIYSHPIGYHGHAAGASIGFWDNQEADPRGEHPLRPNTAWSIELNAIRPVPEWGGQEVRFALEEDAYFDGEAVRFIDGRQDRFHLIPRR